MTKSFKTSHEKINWDKDHEVLNNNQCGFKRNTSCPAKPVYFHPKEEDVEIVKQ